MNLPLTEREARILWSLSVEPTSISAAIRSDMVKSVSQLLENPKTFDGIEWRFTADEALRKTYTEMIRLGIETLIPGDEHWPTERLARLGVAEPVILYVRGDASLLNDERATVGIVGARAATGYGEHVTMELASTLSSKHDRVIVSGAAYGIDGMAHRATLAAEGKTIALLAGGVDRFYPAGNDALLNRIVETGAVVSELPPFTPPTRWRFIQRNRLIAALSDAVVVVEAGERSGSISTAENAKDIGVPVGAIPGPVTSAASAGCHALIRKGVATLVTSADEVIELIELEDADFPEFFIEELGSRS